jgi:ABC-2 type transport system ATP-binding protein
MIHIQDLSFGYSPHTFLFQDLNLELAPGHIFGLLGKNGAGKTSLLKNMAGLVYPQKGRVQFRNENIKNRSVKVLQDLFFIPEDLYFPTLNPIQFARYSSPFYPKFSYENYLKNLEAFEIDPSQILTRQSFGQQKKSLISFALATNTSLVLMDEPTNGLDIPSKAQFRKRVAASLDEEKSILISTHQIRDLETLIDSLLILDRRKIQVNANLDDIGEKLLFTRLPHEPVEGAYQEETLMGNSQILPNLQGEPSKVDLELLFNAVIANNTLVIEALKSK